MCMKDNFKQNLLYTHSKTLFISHVSLHGSFMSALLNGTYPA